MGFVGLDKIRLWGRMGWEKAMRGRYDSIKVLLCSYLVI
jgi:hypothetical protein